MLKLDVWFSVHALYLNQTRPLLVVKDLFSLLMYGQRKSLCLSGTVLIHLVSAALPGL